MRVKFEISNAGFIFSPRLDNLAMSYCALDALLKMNISQDSSAISMIALFDHEEVGSNSAFGAASNFVESVMQRVLSYAPGEKHPDDYGRSISKSFLISADMAHAVHPNYAEKHAKGHAPSLKNLVLKINANQRYTTTSLTSSLLKKMGVELQEFVVRNDSPCGSTIGPILSKIGIRSVDIGAPMLSMHSIREM
jgi:aspartyl aminopeptidase